MKLVEVVEKFDMYVAVVEINGERHEVKGIMHCDNRPVVFESLIAALQNEIKAQFEAFKSSGSLKTIGRFIDENKRLDLMARTHVSNLY